MSSQAGRARVRRAYVTIALLCILVSAGSLWWSVHLTGRVQGQQQMMQRDLCGVVAPFADTPMTKPTSPSQKTTTTTYAWHERFVTLSREFHC